MAYSIGKNLFECRNRRLRQFIVILAGAGKEYLEKLLGRIIGKLYVPVESGLESRIGVDKVFDLVREIRRETDIALCFMTYANVVYSYDAEKFINTCKEIGIDGLILPDLPYEEKDEFLPLCKACGVDLISFVAPTSEDRIAMIAKEATGFIYVVSSLGVTGMRSEITTDLPKIVSVIRANTDTPCAIGFGISGPEQAAKMAGISDGAIIGSAIIRILEKEGKNAPEKIGEFTKAVKTAIMA